LNQDVALFAIISALGPVKGLAAAIRQKDHTMNVGHPICAIGFSTLKELSHRLGKRFFAVSFFEFLSHLNVECGVLFGRAHHSD
jgi:hypothetical protein